MLNRYFLHPFTFTNTKFTITEHAILNEHHARWSLSICRWDLLPRWHSQFRITCPSVSWMNYITDNQPNAVCNFLQTTRHYNPKSRISPLKSRKRKSLNRSNFICPQIWKVQLIWYSYGRTVVWCDSCHYHSLWCAYFRLFFFPFCQETNNDICSMIKKWTTHSNWTWNKETEQSICQFFTLL
jgi:hypothetical protein